MAAWHQRFEFGQAALLDGSESVVVMLHRGGGVMNNSLGIVSVQLCRLPRELYEAAGVSAWYPLQARHNQSKSEVRGRLRMKLALACSRGQHRDSNRREKAALGSQRTTAQCICPSLAAQRGAMRSILATSFARLARTLKQADAVVTLSRAVEAMHAMRDKFESDGKRTRRPRILAMYELFLDRIAEEMERGNTAVLKKLWLRRDTDPDGDGLLTAKQCRAVLRDFLAMFLGDRKLIPFRKFWISWKNKCQRVRKT